MIRRFLVQNLYWVQSNFWTSLARRLGPNENHLPKKKTQRLSRFRELPSGSQQKAACWLLLICKNCSRTREYHKHSPVGSWLKRTRKPWQRCCSMPFISRVRANCKTRLDI